MWILVLVMALISLDLSQAWLMPVAADSLINTLQHWQHMLPLVSQALPLEVAVEKVPEMVEQTPKIIIVDLNNLGALVPPLPRLPAIDVQDTGSLFDKVDTIIKSNPKLGGSTSAYVVDLVNAKAPFLKYLYDPFTDVRDAVSDYLKVNPDISSVSTSSYLSSAKEQLAAAFKRGVGADVENIINSNPDLGRPTSAYLSEGFVSNFKTAGKVVERLIDENPEYKQSTSALVMQWYDNIFVPKVKETGEFLDRSPLFTDTRNLGAMSTSEVVGIFADKFNRASEPTLGPLRSGLSTFFTTWGGQVRNAFSSAVDTPDASDLFGKGIGSLGEAVRTDFGLTPGQKPEMTGTTSEVAKAVLGGSASTFTPPQLDLDVSGGVDLVSKIAAATPEALARASNSLGRQLSEKGEILQTNTLAGLEAAGKGLGDISDGITNIGVPKVVEGSRQVVQGFAEVTTSTVDGLSKIQSDLSSPKELTVDPRIVDKFKGLGDKISQWKFFTDDNHMENGFWEVNARKFIEFSIESQAKLRDATKDYMEAAQAAKDVKQ